jgi:hypothetical protein
MRSIKFYIIAVLGLWLVTGCGDAIIDLEPKDQFTTDVALSTLEGLEGAIYGVYERGRNLCESDDIGNYKCLQTDIIMAGTHLADQQVLNAAFFCDALFNGTNSIVSGIWDGYYIGINRANLIIDGVENVEIGTSQKDIDRKNNVLGQAYFFRAYYHYSLLSRFDRIALVTTANVNPNDPVELVTKDDVMPVIIEDLETAVDLLPETAEVNSVGRVSKGVARHLLAKMYLEVEEWAKAAETADAVINDPAYKLLEDLTQIFSIEHQENSELIFSWQFSQNDASHPQRVSHHWYPLYDRVVGVDRSFEQGARPWSRFQPNDYYWSLFESNDKRLEAYHHRWWFYDSETDPLPEGKQIGDTVKVEDGFTVSLEMEPGRAIQPTTAKYDENSDLLGKDVNESSGFRNIIVYRLAETYVVAAEGYMRSNNNGKALERLNVLRKRAGIANLTSIDQNILLEEHARELGHEGHRFDMLKRLGILHSKIEANNPEVAEYMEPYHVSWPIPRTFIDLTRVEQNEGYNE